MYAREKVRAKKRRFVAECIPSCNAGVSVRRTNTQRHRQGHREYRGGDGGGGGGIWSGVI